MNSWTFFAFLFDSFDVQFLAAVQDGTQRLLDAVQGPVLVGVTLWLAGMMCLEIYSPSGNPIFAVLRRCVRAAIVLALLGAANYISIFNQFALTTFPNEITQAITGAAFAGDTTAAAFDKLLSSGWVGCAQIWTNMTWSLKSILIGLIAGFDFLVGALFIGIAFCVYIVTHIMLGLAIQVGPLFVCMLLWEKTVQIFDSWLRTIGALILTQALLVALLTMMLKTESNILQQIIALNGTGLNINDIAGQLHYLIEAVLLYFIIGFIAPKMPQLAERLIGGAAPGLSQLSAMAHSAVASAAGSAGSRAADGVAAAGKALGKAGAAGMRSIKPAGRAP